MNGSAISYEQVLGLADQLKAASNNMESILSEVQSLFNQIGSSAVWSGDAAGEARAKFDQLSAKFPEFAQATASCQAYLASVVQNYRAIDTKVRSQ